MTTQLTNITYRHDMANEQPLFSRYSHVFERGEMVAVTGPSGAGKTTLLSLLSLLVQPESGDVVVAGYAMADASEDERQLVRRKEIGMIFQTARVFSQLTVAEHVRFAQLCSDAPASQAQDMDRLLVALGLSERLQAVPMALSGGERTRLASLLALAKQPSLLLADEPTASLDRRNAEVLLGLMRETAEQHGTTAVLVTHDPVAMSACDRNLVLEKR